MAAANEWSLSSKIAFASLLFLLTAITSLTALKQAHYLAAVDTRDAEYWDDVLVGIGDLTREEEVWGSGSKRSFPNPCFPLVATDVTALDLYSPHDAPLQCIPRIVILGVMKGATTFLYSSLLRHPMLASSHVKETNFYTADYGSGIYGYAQNFDQSNTLYGSPSSKILFEASPAYLTSATARDKMYAIVPDAQLIVSIRDPVKRAYSHWNYFLFQRERQIKAARAEKGPRAPIKRTANATLEQLIHEDWRYLNMCFDNVIPADFRNRPPPLLGQQPISKADSAYQERDCDSVYAERAAGHPGATSFGGILSKGMYAIHLKWWLQLYDRNQMMIIRFEDLDERGSHTVLNEVAWWLGVPQMGRVDWAVPTEAANVIPYRKPMAKETEEWLREFFRSFNDELYELMGVDYAWSR